MAYTLHDLRMDVRASARNALDSSEYPDRQIDRALQIAGADWIRITRESARLDTLTFTVGSNALPALPVGFTPAQVLDAYLTLSGSVILPSIRVVDVQSVLTAQLLQWPWCTPGYFYAIAPQTSPPTGQPTMVGFTGTAAGIADTLADKAYLLNIWWWQVLTSWTAGAQGAYSGTKQYQVGDVVSSGGTLYQALQGTKGISVSNTNSWQSLGTGTLTDPTSQTFNLSDQSLDIIAKFGAPAVLQYHEHEKFPQSDRMLQLFQQRARQVAAIGLGNRGERELIKDTPYFANGDWVRARGCL